MSTYHVVIHGEEFVIELLPSGEARINGALVRPDIRRTARGAFSVLLDKRVSTVVAEKSQREVRASVRGISATAVVESARAKVFSRIHAAARGGSLEIRAPMPALVVSVLVTQGDPVSAGQGLITLEAMKMENTITAPSAGIVREVLVGPRQAVEKSAPLLILETP